MPLNRTILAEITVNSGSVTVLRHSPPPDNRDPPIRYTPQRPVGDARGHLVYG